MREKQFWNKKRVFITGHTGFKGTWLTCWLSFLGADIRGYSLHPPFNRFLFDILKPTCYQEEDINNFTQLIDSMNKFQPQIVFHMAAQPLVRKSYDDPLETFKTNVLGTVHLLEAVRKIKSVKVVINVTSDKCYAHTSDKTKAFCESDRFGGSDPYSASKGCAELVTESYRSSFLNSESSPRVASVRAGNVIGGGDWAKDRLLPDIMRAFINNKELKIRNTQAIRPWQHVLEPLNGYLLLAERMWDDQKYAEGWNFGPLNDVSLTVDEVIKMTLHIWGEKVEISKDSLGQPFESPILKLDSSKAMKRLKWKPKLSIRESIEWTTTWYKKFAEGEDMGLYTLNQVQRYEKQ
jgi:CDP-glucose 4,6-dehydratase